MIIRYVQAHGAQSWEQYLVITRTNNFKKTILMNISFVVGFSRRSSCILFK